jgi:hypothetical protein
MKVKIEVTHEEIVTLVTAHLRDMLQEHFDPEKVRLSAKPLVGEGIENSFIITASYEGTVE